MGSGRAVLHCTVGIGVLFGGQRLLLLYLSFSFGGVLQSALYSPWGMSFLHSTGALWIKALFGLSYSNTYQTALGGRG
jgi:hypothetical protein